MARDTRQRMVDSAVTLLRERGVAGVTVDAVLAHSETPRGSVYHHFPGGRSELVLAAVHQAGEFVAAMVDDAAAGRDARAAVERIVRFWKRSLVGSDYRAGCPVVAVAVDARPDVPDAEAVVREVFARWRTSLTVVLEADGFTPARARRLATLVVSAVEGAIVLCRARRDLEPLDDVLAELRPLLAPPVLTQPGTPPVTPPDDREDPR